eukprot:CAMPEP_0182876090 /NCGR_PEP_ID=MMETSP0034_2-20130328/13942_1 /TAXON_ID=156128 /ORGANISM="Nephroselmis pyriformis, Strain CCMP717" /LENGTH=289 /DNA_ID=CAMNT_0025008859 /DNA_START=174 /DNA_END=1039 /DNA_ORIENTATION=-
MTEAGAEPAPAAAPAEEGGPPASNKAGTGKKKAQRPGGSTEGRDAFMVTTLYGDPQYFKQRAGNLSFDVNEGREKDPTWPPRRDELSVMGMPDQKQREEKARLRMQKIEAREKVRKPDPEVEANAKAAAARVAKFRREEEQRRKEEIEYLERAAKKSPPSADTSAPPAGDAAAVEEAAGPPKTPLRPKAPKPVVPPTWAPAAEAFAGVPSASLGAAGWGTSMSLLVSELRRDMPELPGLHVPVPDTLLLEGGRLARWIRTGVDGAVEDVDFEGARASDVLGCMAAWARL